MMIFGYARVSSADQNLDRQWKDLEEFGCDRIFPEKKSAKSFDRPVYHEMRSKMRFGDVLVVHDLSRFGRNKKDIKNEWEALIKEEIDIVVLNMPILDTRKYKELEGVGQLITDLVLSLLSWMVEEERIRNKIAQREGIAIAKTKGKYKGRKLTYHPGATGKNKVLYDKIIEMLDQKQSVKAIHEETDVARNTIYRIKDEREKTPEDHQEKARIRMWLRVENNNKFVRGKKKVREEIENSLKYHYDMKHLSDWEYEYYVPYETVEDLKKKVYDIIEDMDFEADMRNCFIEHDTLCDELDLMW